MFNANTQPQKPDNYDSCNVLWTDTDQLSISTAATRDAGTFRKLERIKNSRSGILRHWESQGVTAWGYTSNFPADKGGLEASPSGIGRSPSRNLIWWILNLNIWVSGRWWEHYRTLTQKWAWKMVRHHRPTMDASVEVPLKTWSQLAYTYRC